MENSSIAGRLGGSEIHGFRTMEDLDFKTILEEATSRWLRPNEIHAILCNYKYFTVHVKPMNLPKSGTIVLFDRKMLRNFRKDGHNWKKKKDGKTVKEAHEHLKVGNEERIHVYYAHGEDTPTFVRRCYWLLDKSLEHIVLVHYRETKEGSPATPVNCNPNSAASNPSPSWPLPEESGSVVDLMYHGGSISHLERNESVIKSHERRLHEINTLDWDELLLTDDLRKLNPRKLNSTQEKTASYELSNQYRMNNYKICEDSLSTSKLSPESSDNSFSEQVAWSNPVNYNVPNNLSYQSVGHEATVSSETAISGLATLGGAGPMHSLPIDSSQAQDGFGNLATYVIAESPESVDGQTMESSLLNDQSFTYPLVNNRQASPLGQIFNITDISPAWAPSAEETKILVVGYFNDGHLPNAESTLYLACGDSILPVEVVQAGVYRCLVSPQAPGVMNLYMTFDGHKPISQILTFEFRSPVQPTHTDWEVIQLQMRLAHLLFSSSKGLSIYSTKVSQTAYKEAKVFAKKTSLISDAWVLLSKMIEDTELSFPKAKDKLFELTLQNRVHEWLLEKVASGFKVSECDEQGQGVIHLCAILGYTWAVYPFAWSGLSLDYRDKCGWTALHWAAYCGREKMAATLLSAGAKPNLVTDPTPQNPGGCTAADLASINGYEGLAAYLAEKALVAQFNDMTLAGNVSGSLQTTTNDSVNSGNFTEEEMYLKESLAAYRTAADAAARIQTAFRERSLKVRSEVVEASNPEIEARVIVAAMRIQHAFRHHEARKKMVAAVRIQHRFRTWKVRRDFLNMRRQAIKIQAIFRGHQTRRQYGKLVWSVGVLEKAILRWRLKRKGFRGLQAPPVESPRALNQDNDAEEDFFLASRKQAEERVERSVVRVQAMFRSKRAQEEYRRMKLECDQAKLEYEELQRPNDVQMR
ncbi:hypothetical protein ACS0TY_027225 [Phlomoides rotata]